jgi:sirohydrochlorin ferrochelatase
VRKEPAIQRAILLVDHGSVRAAANATLEEIAKLLAKAAPDVHIEIAHMELAQPTIAEGLDACVAAGATDVTVCPYMLAPGRHSTDDIPRLAREAASRHRSLRLRVSEPLGVEPRLADVVLRRVRESQELDSDQQKEH